MKEKTAYKASIFLAVIGITVMYASSLYLGIEEVAVGDIKKSWTGKNVKINGEVTGFHRSGSTAFIDINDSTGEILVVDFDSSEQVETGEKVNVTGHVSLYEGELEIIAKEISS
ncbi:MAG: exodeoxyribonuclease VII large subunit [Candidatus Nanohaloarchaea archaeon]